MSGILNNKTEDKAKQAPGSGATGIARGAAATIGNTVGSVTDTAGEIAGSAGRGVGSTIESATGDYGKPIGDGIANIGTGVEGATQEVGKGIKNAGQGKSLS
ncbi:hypothetical protein B0T17DRAFT_522413 [Bombardia bombarda]|uniref:Uncharacterized protein n=1 Tax=Bombardia bombarda TaxID=252184 RepID=A0AA40C7E3_9PEZI|nr:hypothetical protein B0T17DRAFT_522413 [Bombardia bombarda]